MRILTLPFFALLLTVGSVPGQPLPEPPPPPGGAGVFIQQALGLGGSYLGVGLLEIDEDRAAELGLGEPYGVEISNVAPDSPGSKKPTPYSNTPGSASWVSNILCGW